eukprot:4382381-Pleurochrysis_carterae.AAC.2
MHLGLHRGEGGRVSDVSRRPEVDEYVAGVQVAVDEIVVEQHLEEGAEADARDACVARHVGGAVRVLEHVADARAVQKRLDEHALAHEALAEEGAREDHARAALLARKIRVDCHTEMGSGRGGTQESIATQPFISINILGRCESKKS